MFKTGNDKESLVKVLESITELTGVDRVIHSGQSFQINGQISGRSLKWSISADPDGFSSQGAETAKGRGLPKLEKELSKLNQETAADEGIVVLSLADASLSRNYDNTIHTIWYVVDPCGIGFDDTGHTFTNGMGIIKYPILELDLTEAEYKSCETQLAFYDEFNRVLYPMQKCAERAIAGFLDCSCVFKYKANPLFSAGFLAERLAERFTQKKEVRFLYRKRTERVRPLISIVGRNYTLYKQDKLIKEACRIVESHSVAHLDKWCVTDELTSAVFAIDCYSNTAWQPEIEVKISDMVGNALSVSAYICMGKGRILLKRNQSIHWGCFEKQGGIAALFDGIFEALEEFAKGWEVFCDKTVDFDPGMLAGYEKVIGKKRFTKLKVPTAGIQKAVPLLYSIVEQTSRSIIQLNPRWERALETENLHFYCRLMDSAEAQNCSEQPEIAAMA